MPEVEIRPANQTDLPQLMALQPVYNSSRVWQLDKMSADGTLGAQFREVRLPREARIEYSRGINQVFLSFSEEHEYFLTALIDDQPIGFIHLSDRVAPRTAWVKDLIVREELRHRGIGAALLLAGLDWSAENGYRRVVVEMQSKNYPAICLVRKLGFEFAGYSDQFYSNQDIALFFGRPLK